MKKYLFVFLTFYCILLSTLTCSKEKGTVWEEDLLFSGPIESRSLSSCPGNACSCRTTVEVTDCDNCGSSWTIIVFPRGGGQGCIEVTSLNTPISEYLDGGNSPGQGSDFSVGLIGTPSGCSTATVEIQRCVGSLTTIYPKQGNSVCCTNCIIDVEIFGCDD